MKRVKCSSSTTKNGFARDGSKVGSSVSKSSLPGARVFSLALRYHMLFIFCSRAVLGQPDRNRNQDANLGESLCLRISFFALTPTSRNHHLGVGTALLGA